MKKRVYLDDNEDVSFYALYDRLINLSKADAGAAAAELVAVLAIEGVDFHTILDEIAYGRFAPQFAAAAIEIDRAEAESAAAFCDFDDDGGPL